MAKDSLCKLEGKRCERILFWSNPAKIHDAIGSADGGRRRTKSRQNNAKTLNNTAKFVANFRCRFPELAWREAHPEGIPARHRYTGNSLHAVETEKFLDERVLDRRRREAAEAPRCREETEGLREVPRVEEQGPVGHSRPGTSRGCVRRRRSSSRETPRGRPTPCPHAARTACAPEAAPAQTAQVSRADARSDTSLARDPARSRRERNTRSDEGSRRTDWSSSGERRRGRHRESPCARTFLRRRP